MEREDEKANGRIRGGIFYTASESGLEAGLGSESGEIDDGRALERETDDREEIAAFSSQRQMRVEIKQ